MVSEVNTVGYGFTSDYYSARKTDSAKPGAVDRQSVSGKLSDQTATEGTPRFTDRKESTETGDKKSLYPTDHERQSRAFFQAALSTPFSHGASLAQTDLAGRNLQGGSLGKADLRSSDLTGANLVGADLAGADLTGANITGANFSGANIAGTNLNGTVGITYDSSGRRTIERSISLPKLDFNV